MTLSHTVGDITDLGMVANRSMGLGLGSFCREGKDASEICQAARIGAVPAIIRPIVVRSVTGRVRTILWQQGVLRHSDKDIVESALREWRAVLRVMSDGPFFFGDEPTGVDAIVFGALATSVPTPIQSPIRDFLRSQPACVAYAERMRARFFPELVDATERERAA